ncbi:MAG: hypothetical protein L0Z54_00560 [Thermoplasmata archaeon]|nr:hypothetical protein [Thermoplasmata archaeon]
MTKGTGVRPSLERQRARDGARRLELRLLAVAIIILATSVSVLAHNVLNARTAGATFQVNGVSFEWDSLGKNFTARVVDGNVGYPLSDLVNATGLAGQESREYRIIGADGYQRTVGWTHMLKGIIIARGKEVYFPDLAKQYSVHDVVAIEVV